MSFINVDDLFLGHDAFYRGSAEDGVDFPYWMRVQLT